MREILFRGKREDNGEWAYGCYVEAEKLDKSGTEYFIIEKDADGNSHMIIPETLGQWTGSKDKNGKRIFEGDILRGYCYPFYDELNDTFNYYAIAKWFEPAFGLLTIKAPNATVRGISAGNVDDMSDFDSDEWEIIGNIHDNPELLGDYLELLEVK